jgi:hypothetical protein
MGGGGGETGEGVAGLIDGFLMNDQAELLYGVVVIVKKVAEGRLLYRSRSQFALLPLSLGQGSQRRLACFHRRGRSMNEVWLGCAGGSIDKRLAPL